MSNKKFFIGSKRATRQASTNGRHNNLEYSCQMIMMFCQIYVNLSYKDVDLSDNDVDLSDNDVDLSDNDVGLVRYRR